MQFDYYSFTKLKTPRAARQHAEGRMHPAGHMLLMPALDYQLVLWNFMVVSDVFLIILTFICSDRILTFGIRIIRSPVKVGIGYYKTVKLPVR